MKGKFDFDSLYPEYQKLGIEELIYKKEYVKALEIMETITDKRKKITMVLGAITQISAIKISNEYGGSKFFKKREDFEKAKMGIGDCSPYTAFLLDDEGKVENTGDMLDFVPPDNPVRKYLESLVE